MPAADDGHPGAEDEQEDAEADAAGDEEGEDEPEYEITVDGQPTTVSLGELRDGYIRTATFHSRLNKVNESRAVVDQEHTRVTQLRDLYVKGLQFLDARSPRRCRRSSRTGMQEYNARSGQRRSAGRKNFQSVHDKLEPDSAESGLGDSERA